MQHSASRTLLSIQLIDIDMSKSNIGQNKHFIKSTNIFAIFI